jgi:hypothetical protein
MTILTLNDNIKLSKTNFLNVDDLLKYLLDLSSTNIEFEDFSKEEIKDINNLESAKTFKNIVRNLKI